MKKLDINQKQQTQYAVALWLRDEQIKLNCATVKGRIQPVSQPREEPIAVVGFGPSLKETWEGVRNFKFIISCSGAHKFLLERGIVPTYHAEVDPRPHKIELLGPPHPDVEYLVASTCSPDYVKHLAGFNVKLWHVFDNSEDGRRLLPAGEWQITGGCDIGLRSITLASFLGFRELHVFGLDGSAKDGERHADVHPNGGKKFSEVDYNGVTYITTPAMMEAAKQTVHELQQMPSVRAKFYGEGLTQALMKDFKPGPEKKDGWKNVVAFEKPLLISAEYQELNSRLHSENLAYGVGGGRYGDTVKKMAEKLAKNKPFISVLDYGCGKGYLAKALSFPIAEYDPAIPGKQESPRPADLVCCFDVLEHIEPDRLDYVLGDLQRCVLLAGYFIIHTGPSGKHLADGRNAHLIQRGPEWWTATLSRFFRLLPNAIKFAPPLLHIVVEPLPRRPKFHERVEIVTA